MFENKNLATMKSSKNVPLPIGSGIIETINSRLSPTIINRPKLVDAIQEFVSSDDVKRINVDQFVNQKTSHELRKADKGKTALKACIIQGVMMWRNLWKQESHTVNEPIYVPDPSFVPDPSRPDAKPKMLHQGDIPVQRTNEHWTFEYKSPNMLAWEPTCTDKIQHSEFIRERSFMSLNQLMRWQSEGRIQGVDQIRRIIPSGMNQSDREDLEERRKRALGEVGLPAVYADDKSYKVEEWFACLTWQAPAEVQPVQPAAQDNAETQMVEGDEQQTPAAKPVMAPNQTQTRYGEFHFFIVEDSVLILFEENQLPEQRKPYGSCPMVMKPGSVVGLGASEVIQNVADQVNTFAGKQNDLVERASNPITYYSDASGLNGRAAFIRNGGLQPVLDVKQIYQPPTDATPVKINQEYINFCIQLCRDITGANDQVQGIEGADTATEYQGLVAAAGTRFAEVGDTINQFFVADLAKTCFLYYQAYGVDGQMIVHDTVNTGTSISLTRADLTGQYDFSPTVSQDIQDKEKAKVEDTAFIQAMATIPPAMMGGQVYNMAKHIQEISLPLRNVKNGRDYFLPAPPPMPIPGPAGPISAPPAAVMPQPQTMGQAA